MRTTNLLSQYEANRIAICDLTGIDAAEHFWLVYGAAEKLLDSQIADDPDAKRMLLEDQQNFWPWFHNQFNIANQVFVDREKLNAITESIAKAEIFKSFELQTAFRSTYERFIDEAMTSNLISDAYGHMIGLVIKKATKQLQNTTH